MKILEAAKRAGLTVKTVRYYANIGMVTPHQDPATGYRDYSEEDIAKLQFVGKARRFDFSVEECRELLGLYEDRNRPSREVKALTLKKVAEIDARLAELQAEVSSAEGVDLARVDAIRQQIADGSYTVDADRVADALMTMENELL